MDPGSLGELWQLTGHEMAEDVALEPVSPFYRLNWPDGAQFDYSNDEDALRHEIAKLNPADISGYERFLEYASGACEEAYVRSEEHTSELQSLMRNSYAVFCLKKKKLLTKQ